jgi:hypothetical protein
MWHYSWRWPSESLLSVPECDLFHGVKRSVTKGGEIMFVVFYLDLVRWVTCV